MGNEDEVIIASTAFDIPTDNYEEFDQEIDSGRLGKKLVQANSLKGTTRELQFYGGNHLLVNFVNKKQAQNFRVNLAWLSSEPVHSKIIIWKWLYAALTFTTVSGIFIYLAVSETIKLEYSIAACIVFLTAALIFLLIFLYQMRNEYIFKSQFGGAQIFLIENKKPEQSTFDNFFIQLQQSIEKAKVGISVSDRLVGELKMCRRLRDENIINDDAYTVARTTIFKHEQYKT